MTTDEYLAIAGACDRILREEAGGDRLAVTRLHPVSEHPVHTADFESLAAELRGAAASAGGASRVRRTLSLARGALRPLVGARGFAGEIDAVAAAPVDVLIVSWLVNTAHVPNAADFYFGDLQQRLAQRALRSLLVLRNQTPARWGALHGAVFRDGASARVLLPDTTGLAEEIGFLRRCAAVRDGLADAAGPRAPGDMPVARYASAGALTTPVVENLRLEAQLDRLCAATRPRLVITLYEGHAWERVVFRAAHRAGAVAAGYQHTIIREHAHPIRRTIGAPGACDPDVILALGDATRDMLARAPGLDGVPVIVWGSHRRDAVVRAEAPKAGTTVLVLPEGIEAEARYLCEAAFAAATRLPGCSFILRMHPVFPFERIGGDLGPRPANVSLSTGSFEDDLRRAAVCLYRGSSTALYAILAGLRPLYLRVPGAADIDPLYALSAWRTHAHSIDTLVSQLQHSTANPDDWRTAAEYCDRYTRALSDDALRELWAFATAGAPS